VIDRAARAFPRSARPFVVLSVEFTGLIGRDGDRRDCVGDTIDPFDE
jgi:hypothetical protein